MASLLNSSRGSSSYPGKGLWASDLGPAGLPPPAERRLAWMSLTSACGGQQGSSSLNHAQFKKTLNSDFTHLHIYRASTFLKDKLSY